MTMKRIFLGSFIKHPLLTDLFYKTRKTLEDTGQFKWTRTPDNFHITFHFFGQIPLSEIEKIEVVLKDLLNKPLEMPVQINGLDYFTRKGRPAVLYARVVPSDELKRLHNEIQKLLLEHGLIDKKADKFVPHITFARIKKVTPAFFDKMQALSHIEQPILISQIKVEIIESILSLEGALYQSLE